MLDPDIYYPNHIPVLSQDQLAVTQHASIHDKLTENVEEGGMP